MGGGNNRTIIFIFAPEYYRCKVFLSRCCNSRYKTFWLLYNWCRTICINIWYCERNEQKIHEREKYQKNKSIKKVSIKLKVNRITQRLSLSLPNENSLVVIFSTDLCHVFGCEEAVYGMRVFMSGAGPHFPKFPYDIVRIHTLMLYSDIVEYNIVGDTKAALLRCIPFISKIKNADIISSGQYMNHQNFPNLQFEKILKNSFHSIKLELRNSYGQEIPFNSVGVTRAVLMFRRASDNHFQIKVY